MTGEEVEGHFWILFDHYQSRLDQHGLGSVESTEKGESNFVWMGHSLDETLLTDVFKLRTIFRTTSSIARYIGDECLVPDWEIGEENGGYKISHNIQGLFPKDPEFIECFSIEDAYIKQELKKCIVRTIEESVQFKNNHPGDVAISLPDEDFNIIFGNSASEFVMEFNAQMRSTFVQTQTKIAPQISTEIDESLQFKHNNDIKKCDCKTYIGSVSSMKGLTIPIVDFIAFSLQLKDIKKNRDLENVKNQKSPGGISGPSG